MVRHWSRAIAATESGDGARAGMRRSRAVNLTGTPTRPAHVHAVVLVAGVTQPVLHAVALARSFTPDSLEAVTATADQDETVAIRTHWERLGLADCPLRIVDAPYRSVGPPLVRYLRERPTEPRGVVVVYVPEYVVAHWWENLLHNQTALRLRAHLLRLPGVVVVDVPYRLGSREHGWLR